MLALKLRSFKVHALAFSPDGRTLAAGAGCYVVLVDWPTGRERVWLQPRISHASRCTALTFSADGRAVAAGYSDHRAAAWEVGSFDRVADHPAALWPTAPLTLVRGADPFAVWQARPRAAGGAVAELLPLGGKRRVAAADGRPPPAAWWDPAGRRYLGWGPGAVTAYTAADPPAARPRSVRDLVWRRPAPPPALRPAASYPVPAADPVAALRPDGRSLLVKVSEAVVGAWDFEAGAEVGRWHWPVGFVRSVAVSADGTVAGAGGNKGAVVVWDLDG